VIEDNTFLPLIYEADPDDDIHDPKDLEKGESQFWRFHQTRIF
jgi:hypothetical protein